MRRDPEEVIMLRGLKLRGLPQCRIAQRLGVSGAAVSQRR
jgi:predicted transcriptional regulator